MVLGERVVSREADVALREQVVRPVARAGGQVGDPLIRSRRCGVEVGGLLGVANVEPDVIDIDEPQEDPSPARSLG